MSVSAAASVIAALTVGLAISTWRFVKEREALKRAMVAEQAAKEQAKRDAEVRDAVLRHLRSALRGGDKALVGNSAYRRYLKTPDEKHFEIDDNRIIEDARYDGLYVLRTNTTLNALAVMLRYRELLRVEDIF